ncbi:peptidoglycan binding protein CsiV [Pseudoalteromonas sp. MMG010]|uniref:peptidoglycan binding protein CsiV n=1 Tax=Pseudoalteromonas sp. MMG010 TaxID=2822685 RepID=UPI001B3A6A77|nr:peptidoglycan binding protein CsiV [Pseudoalteromonas sp. MMG010]MBQ4832236.1 peptidoglycan binding protein CsiV [Pseudoalteromonas sp. MMG010]
MLLRNVCLIMCLVASNSVFAERWFEVEVLIFKQRPAPYLQEDFTLKHEAISDKNTLDLLTPIFNEQAMQACINGDSNFIKKQQSAIFPNHTDSLCNSNLEPVQGFSQLPVLPLAPALDSMDKPYLLAPEQLQFVAQKRSLDRKGLTPLLHTGWRFEGQSKSRAPSIHLYAGKQLETLQAASFPQDDKYNTDYISLINAHSDNEDRDNDTAPNWELDGLFKIHLRHYLYITANFDIKQPLDNGDIELARFSQFKRVISSQIHYFDHPRMGMIVQIRKFKH